MNANEITCKMNIGTGQTNRISIDIDIIDSQHESINQGLDDLQWYKIVS